MNFKQTHPCMFALYALYLGQNVYQVPYIPVIKLSN